MAHVVEWADLEATKAFAARLAAELRPGDVIALWGDLGAGKTTLARALIRARMEGPGEEEVPSPTFTLVQTYETPDLTIAHLDLYRLRHPEEAVELGIDDLLDECALLIEWPGRLEHLIPKERLDITISIETATARRAVMEGHGAWKGRLEEASLDA